MASRLREEDAVVHGGAGAAAQGRRPRRPRRKDGLCARMGSPQRKKEKSLEGWRRSFFLPVFCPSLLSQPGGQGTKTSKVAAAGAGCSS